MIYLKVKLDFQILNFHLKDLLINDNLSILNNYSNIDLLPHLLELS
jgi:hypothetical protein